MWMFISAAFVGAIVVLSGGFWERFPPLRNGGSDMPRANIKDGYHPRRAVGRQGGKAEPYEEWTKRDLAGRASDLEIPRRSTMTKSELIDALRSH
jgi:hypothetical protein